MKPEGAALSHKRVLRASEAIRRELGVILDRKLADPRIGMVTVTRVDLSEDLRYAKVFVSFLGDDEERDESLRLRPEQGRSQQDELAHALRFRVAPELTFLIDDSSKNYIRISSVLKDIQEEDSEGRSEQPDEDDGGESQEDTGSA